MTTHPTLLPGLSQRPEIELAEGLSFRPGRLHEGCGPGRRVLAAMLAGGVKGAVVWAQLRRCRETLFPGGLSVLCDPGKILWVRAEWDIDLLWVMEEALRSGAVSLAVAELSTPPGLTPVRRLHLAAEAAPNLPMGLLLTPGQGGAPGVESRWHIAPIAQGGWRLRRLRARLAPETELHVVMEGGRLKTRSLKPISEGAPALDRSCDATFPQKRQ